jgi:hypothetical protein
VTVAPSFSHRHLPLRQPEQEPNFMTQFSEIKITGIDTNRPPRVRKEAYIDLFYQLSEDAPEEWCDDFVSFGRQVNPLAKIDKIKPGFINTYINDMDEIPKHFEQIKQAVVDCNTQYMEKLMKREQALARENVTAREEGGQQFKLDEIIAALDFDE